MENITRSLTEMYDDMLRYLDQFKNNKYQTIMEEMQSKYGTLLEECRRLYEEAEGEEQEAVLCTLADAVADHVTELMEQVPKRKKEVKAVDYNMVMAVYFIPSIRYTRSAEGDAIAEKIVTVWNERKVTPLVLQSSSYDDVQGGFKKNILCYITTAVCECQNKPDDCYELTTLRRYRDDYLMQTKEGRSLVQEYYNIAPRIVWAIRMQPDKDRIYQNLYKDYLMPCIHYVEEKRNEECKDLYVDMVRGLEERFVS